MQRGLTLFTPGSPPRIHAPRRGKRQTRGAAMVTALLAIALAMILLSSITEQMRFDLRRTSNILGGQQLRQYALGGEILAREVLEQDAEEGMIQDTLFETWAEDAPVFPLENGGVITGRMEDLQGRFNLNNLVQQGTPNPTHVERFRRLLEAVNGDPELADAVVDWMDPNDDITGTMGAESDYYLSLNKPYRPTNTLMITPMELLMVKGFDQSLFQALEPYVTTLPEGTGLNVNTAPAILLASLDPAISRNIAESLVADRTKDGYKDIGSFITELESAKIRPKGGLTGLTLFSQHFLAEIQVKYADQQMRLRSYLYRNKEGIVTVTHRTQEYY